MKHFFNLLLCLCCSGLASGQTSGTDTTTSQQIPYEKVYLHTDRELYSPGDTVWFKAYLTSGLTHRLQQGYKNVYAELVSDSGKVEASRLLLSINGESHGDFALPRELADGQYTVRAHTQYLESFGEESFFHKRILVTRVKNSMSQDASLLSAKKIADAMFFPEGGFLIQNATNHVAFKAFSADGKGIEASGKIVDESGETVTTFKTSYLGMGSFVLMPEEGKTYTALIDSLPGFKYSFDKIAENGVALHYQNTEEGGLATFSRNIKTTGSQTYTLVASHKGVKLFSRELTINGFSQALKLGNGLFPAGITKLTLMDSANSIVAERLIFEPNNGAAVKINLEKEEFVTRENVNLSIETLLQPGDSLLSTLSVSVANLGYYSASGNSQTIESYLLLDSELKGTIEEPASYFFDSENIASAEKLDLLMRVQGWRNYYWDYILAQIPENNKGWDDAGLTVSGTVKTLLREKPIANREVKLGPLPGSFEYLTAQTDSTGNFSITRVFARDTAKLSIRAMDSRRGARVILKARPDFEPPMELDVSGINQTIGRISPPGMYMRRLFARQMSERRFNLEEGSILLDEVQVSAKYKIQDDDNYDFKKPGVYMEDNFWIITNEDYQFESIYNFLSQKAKSHVLGLVDKLGRPLVIFYIDGKYVSMLLNPVVEAMNIHDLYRIDLVKYNPYEVYYLYTNPNSPSFRPGTTGQATLQISGFQKPNEFYSPKYTLDNLASKQPDYRPTLFWSPTVVMENGKTSINFFTCDNLAEYAIFVEGITKNGNILSGVKQFSVTEFNPAKE
jgi:hypothetical protein